MSNNIRWYDLGEFRKKYLIKENKVIKKGWDIWGIYHIILSIVKDEIEEQKKDINVDIIKIALVFTDFYDSTSIIDDEDFEKAKISSRNFKKFFKENFLNDIKIRNPDRVSRFLYNADSEDIEHISNCIQESPFGCICHSIESEILSDALRIFENKFQMLNLNTTSAKKIWEERR